MGGILESLKKALSPNRDRTAGGGEENTNARRDGKVLAYLVVLGVAGVALLFLAGDNPAPNYNPASPAATIAVPEMDRSVYEDEVEKELTLTLGQMAGVGDVKIYITWEGGLEKSLASRTTRDVSRTTETARDGSTRTIVSERTDSEPVIIRRKEEEDVLVESEKHPAVRGVLVVADGAHDSHIKREIMRAVETALDVSPHQIYVVPKKR